MSLGKHNIGIFSEMRCSKFEGKILIHQAFGRLVDELAKSFSKCYLSIPLCPKDDTKDHEIQSDNVELMGREALKSSFRKIFHPLRILRAGKKLVDSSDIIFTIGTMPYLSLVHLYAIFRGKVIVQWMAGDLRASLSMNPNAKTLKGRLKSAFAWFDELWFHLIIKFRHVRIIASGCALYEKYKSPRTKLVVSSSVKEGEFYYREDTCKRNPVRILFIGETRPGKGLRYLVEALGQLKTSRRIQLAIVGDSKKYLQEKAYIKERIDELGLKDTIEWVGYVRFLSGLFDEMRRSDIFVLPTLSEGAPQVLVEARAYGLPVISTSVGGIPSSVKDGEDGILVPPKNSLALAEAIDKVIDDNSFRKKLISNGYKAAKKFTLERFVNQLTDVFKNTLSTKGK